SRDPAHLDSGSLCFLASKSRKSPSHLSLPPVGGGRARWESARYSIGSSTGTGLTTSETGFPPTGRFGSPLTTTSPRGGRRAPTPRFRGRWVFGKPIRPRSPYQSPVGDPGVSSPDRPSTKSGWTFERVGRFAAEAPVSCRVCRLSPGNRKIQAIILPGTLARARTDARS